MGIWSQIGKAALTATATVGGAVIFGGLKAAEEATEIYKEYQKNPKMDLASRTLSGLGKSIAAGADVAGEIATDGIKDIYDDYQKDQQKKKKQVVETRAYVEPEYNDVNRTNKAAYPKSNIEDAVIVNESQDTNIFKNFKKIAGVTHNGRQDIVRKLETRCQLEAVREPYNEYDKNAIALYSPRGGMLGFIKKDLASQLAPQMDGGKSMLVFANEVTGGYDGRNLGVNISIELGYFHPEEYYYQEGLKWFHSPDDSDDEKAFQFFEKAAGYKLPKGINMLGEMYQYGYGCVQDDEKALSLYDEASRLGNARGSFRAGWLVLHKNFRFGKTYTKEEIIPDYARAVQYYRLALEQGGYDDQMGILENFRQTGNPLIGMDFMMLSN